MTRKPTTFTLASALLSAYANERTVRTVRWLQTAAHLDLLRCDRGIPSAEIWRAL